VKLYFLVTDHKQWTEISILHCPSPGNFSGQSPGTRVSEA